MELQVKVEELISYWEVQLQNHHLVLEITKEHEAGYRKVSELYNEAYFRLRQLKKFKTLSVGQKVCSGRLAGFVVSLELLDDDSPQVQVSWGGDLPVVEDVTKLSPSLESESECVKFSQSDIEEVIKSNESIKQLQLDSMSPSYNPWGQSSYFAAAALGGEPVFARLAINDILCLDEMQQRIKTDPTVIREYQQMLDFSDPPAILVYRVGKRLILVDGFHRIEASRRKGKDVIPALIYEGSWQDATFAACTANAYNRQAMSNADKRRATQNFLMALDQLNEEERQEKKRIMLGKLGPWSLRDVAQCTGCSYGTVKNIKAEMEMEAKVTHFKSGDRVMVVCPDKSSELIWVGVGERGTVSGYNNKKGILVCWDNKKIAHNYIHPDRIKVMFDEVGVRVDVDSEVVLEDVVVMDANQGEMVGVNSEGVMVVDSVVDDGSGADLGLGKSEVLVLPSPNIISCGSGATLDQLNPILQVLLRQVKIEGQVIEPCAGSGPVIKVLPYDGGFESEIACPNFNPIKRETWEILAQDGVDWVVTHPPADQADQLLPLAFEYARVGLAALVSLSFLEPVFTRSLWLAQNADHLSNVILFGGGVQGLPHSKVWLVWRKDWSWSDRGLCSPFSFSMV